MAFSLHGRKQEGCSTPCVRNRARAQPPRRFPSGRATRICARKLNDLKTRYLLDSVPHDITCLGCIFAAIAFPFAVWAMVVSTAWTVFIAVVAILIGVLCFEVIRTSRLARNARWLEVTDEEFEVGRRRRIILRARFDDIVDIYMVQKGGKPPFVNDYVVVLADGNELRFPVHGLQHRRALVELFETKAQRKFSYRKND